MLGTADDVRSVTQGQGVQGHQVHPLVVHILPLVFLMFIAADALGLDLQERARQWPWLRNPTPTEPLQHGHRARVM